MNTVYKFITTFFICAPFLLGVTVTQAATLSFGTTGRYSVGDIVSVPVVLSTATGESANAVSAKMTFSTNMLTLLSVSKIGSLITLWPAEPQFSQNAGTAQFEGVVLNPGWSGSGGTVLTLTFQAKSSGTAALVFTDASVLANDGQGTNILSAASPGSVTIAPVAISTPPPSVPTTITAIPVPHITSTAYPDEKKWYSAKEGVFSWITPSDVTSVRILYNRTPDSVPTVEYAPPISQKKIVSTSDGLYYFHAQFKTAKGWGPVGHFKFQIDTTPPLLPNIRLAHSDITKNPQPILLFNTTDELSGIDHYTVQVGKGNTATFPAENVASNPYTPPLLGPGNTPVTVVAYDKAGNAATSSTSIHVDAIDVPTITEYSPEINQGDLFRIRGNTYPGAKATVALKDPQGVITTDSAFGNGLGDFTLVWTRPLMPGVYSFTVSAMDARGGVSNLSDPRSIHVKAKNAVLFGFPQNPYVLLEIIAALIMGLLSLVAVFWLGVLWARRRQPAVHFEHEEAAFLDELKSEHQLLEKAAHHRKLTTEEEIILEHIKLRMKSIKRDLK